MCTRIFLQRNTLNIFKKFGSIYDNKLKIFLKRSANWSNSLPWLHTAWEKKCIYRRNVELNDSNLFFCYRCMTSLHNVVCDIKWRLNTLMFQVMIRSLKLTEKFPDRYDHILNPKETERSKSQNKITNIKWVAISFVFDTN